MEKGDLLCYLEGTIRIKTGEIKRGSFLIVGTEGNYGMAIFDGDRLWQKREYFSLTKSGTLQRKEV